MACVGVGVCDCADAASVRQSTAAAETLRLFMAYLIADSLGKHDTSDGFVRRAPDAAIRRRKVTAETARLERYSARLYRDNTTAAPTRARPSKPGARASLPAMSA